jgi:hypothetical protein
MKAFCYTRCAVCTTQNVKIHTLDILWEGFCLESMKFFTRLPATTMRPAEESDLETQQNRQVNSGNVEIERRRDGEVLGQLH